MLRGAIVTALLAAALHAPSALAQQDQRAEVARAADAMRDRVIAWRRDIHQHPELGNREFRTAALVAEHLQALGLEDIRTGVAHTGVTAVLRGARPGPRIALRADMDALPVTEQTGLPFASTATAEYRGETVGVMHACGHDTHVAILMGVAEALAGMRSELAGEVLFIFQPAEEGAPEGEGGGAEMMLAEGIFDRFQPDAVFGLHVMSALNAGQIGVRPGALMAGADLFRILVKGVQVHGSRPWHGVDPVVTAAQIINSAQTIVSRSLDITKEPAVLTFGAVNGGNRGNIIPESVELLGTVRTFDEGMRSEIHERLTSISEKIAAANGATVQVQIPHEVGYPVTVNDPALTAAMRPSLEAAAGAGNVITVPATTGGEDFSFLAQRAPGMFFFVGGTPAGEDAAAAPTNHSPYFHVDETALDVGLRALLQVSLDYLDGAGAAAR